MTALNLAVAGYGKSVSSVRTPRDIEYDAFARVTRMLRVAASEGSMGFSRLCQALHDNRSLWTALAMDVAEPANLLPPPLRAQIFYLAEFTMHHSAKVLKGDASVAPLIDINTAVMRGLRGDQELG